MRHTFLAASLPALVLACGGSSAEPASPAGLGPVSLALRAGAGQRVLDLPVGHSHAGYAQSRRLGYPATPADPGSPFAGIFPATRGMESPPAAKVLVLENGGGRVVLAKVDAVFTTAELYLRVVELARERLGEDVAGQLLLQASHTHAGPCRISLRSVRADFLVDEPPETQEALVHGCDTFSQESLDRMAGSVVAALGDALATLRPARLGWGQGLNDGASVDRRCQNDWLYGPGGKDPTVTVLRVEEPGGAPIAVLFHFALHGTIYSGTNRLLSTDAPGHAEYAVERLFDRPVVAIHLQGAAGDVAPSGDQAGHRGAQQMKRAGGDLARTVRSVWDAIEPHAEAEVQAAVRWIPLGRAALGYAPGEFPEDGALLCNPLEVECRGGRLASEDLVCLGYGEPGGGKRLTGLAVARIGDLSLLTLPGEPTAAIGRELARRGRALGFREALVLGYALDYDGYILAEDDWWSGGYEPTVTFWGWRYAKHVLGESAALLGELASGGPAAAGLEAPPAPALAYEPVHPAPALVPPSIEGELPAEAERLAELRLSFHGGDPALGTPEVELQVSDARGRFQPVLLGGWIPVTNLHGAELVTFYRATPSQKEAPDAPARDHLWEVAYELPPDLPEGRYRLVARGHTAAGPDAPRYELASRTVEVRAARDLPVDLELRVEGGRLRLDARLRWPAAVPSYSVDRNDDGFQLSAFRLLDPDAAPPVVPAGGARPAADARVTFAGAGELTFPLAPERTAASLSGSVELPGPGRYVASLPAGALVDAFGNSSAAVQAAVEVP